jgi:hypothetical protein
MDPLIGGLVTGGLGLFQGLLGSGAQEQEYANQVAYKKASDQYAQWSAGMQAKQADTNNQYQYWQQTVNYNQSLIYTNQMRNFELSKAIVNAEEIARARSSSGAEYARNSQALSEAFAQASMADAVAMFQYQVQSVKSAAAIGAGGQEGNSIDRRMNDYARQLGDMETMKQINQGFKNRQYTREQASAVSDYLNKYNSQQFYQQQEYMDPIAPFAPLPTLINPPGPSMVGGAPSSGTAFLGSALGAVGTGFNTYNSLNAYTNSGRSGSNQSNSTPVVR